MSVDCVYGFRLVLREDIYIFVKFVWRRFVSSLRVGVYLNCTKLKYFNTPSFGMSAYRDLFTRSDRNIRKSIAIWIGSECDVPF